MFALVVTACLACIDSQPPRSATDLDTAQPADIETDGSTGTQDTEPSSDASLDSGAELAPETGVVGETTQPDSDGDAETAQPDSHDDTETAQPDSDDDAETAQPDGDDDAETAQPDGDDDAETIVPDTTCGGVACPTLTGFNVSCNARAHCEYARTSQTEPWHADDVWVYVPPGSFLMGSPEDEPDSFPTEHPIREVTIAHGYLIAKLEVTVRLYEACEAAGSCSAPGVDVDWSSFWGLSRSDNGRAQHPQNGLAWAQAESVCAFIGGRKPTSAEWEFAANGPGAHRRHPWGEQPVPVCGIHAVFADDSSTHSGHGCGLGGTWVVGPAQRTSGMSAIGAHDMGGNVMEWVDDCFHESYAGAPNDGSAWIVGDCERRSTRGGSFVFLGNTVRNAFVWSAAPEERNALIGARCVRTLL